MTSSVHDVCAGEPEQSREVCVHSRWIPNRDDEGVFETALQRTLRCHMQLAHEHMPGQQLSTSTLPLGVEVHVVTAPATRVGGDFYDYFLIDKHRLAVVIADVSGKDERVGTFVDVSRRLLRQHALSQRNPALAMQALNADLCAGNDHLMFVTAFFGVLDSRNGQLDYVNAGHNPPVIRGQPARVRVLPRNQNVALAVLEGAQFRPGRATLRPGDTVLLYTDGVTEATDPSGRMFGEQRLLDIVMRHCPGQASLPRELLKKVREFEKGNPQVDDIACVALRYTPVWAALA